MINLPIVGFQRSNCFLHDLSGFLLYYTRPDMRNVCNKFKYSKLNSSSKALVAMHFSEPDLIPRSWSQKCLKPAWLSNDKQGQ